MTTEVEPGRTAYEARFAGEKLGKRGVAPAWADLPEDARAVWRRVEAACATIKPAPPVAPQSREGKS